MSASPSPPVVIEKTMSASVGEFHRSMAVLDPALQPSTSHTLPCGPGTVSITYEPLPAVTLGTLLALPRARVTLSFTNTSGADRTAFLPRFELAFQRGGG
jgi:hypothetical protein